MTPPAFRWAVVGSSAVCEVFVKAILDLPQEFKHKVVAVSCWDVDDARKFASTFAIELFFDSFEEMLASCCFDIVFVGCAVERRFCVASAALCAGAAVLCAAPLALTVRQTRQLVREARAQVDRGVFLMEAAWARVTPTLAAALSHVTCGDLGQLTAVSCSMGADLRDMTRREKDEAGASLQLGVHGVHLLLALSGTVSGGRGAAEWQCVKAVGCVNDRGVDSTVSVCLCAKTGRQAGQSDCDDSTLSHCVASMVFSNECHLEDSAFIAGSKGNVQLSAPFHTPLSLINPSGEEQLFPHCAAHTTAPPAAPALLCCRLMALHAAQCLTEGREESPLVPLEDSLLCAEILETIRHQLGVVYPQDSFHCANDTFRFDNVI